MFISSKFTTNDENVLHQTNARIDISEHGVPQTSQGSCEWFGRHQK